jgi:hypothetical protein
MRTLFAISIVAVLALLWASISIAQYISRARQRRRALNDRVKELPGATLISADYDQDFAAQAIAGEDLAEHHPPPPDAERKSERADLAYFNKDMGDLSDPYQAPRIRTKTRTEQ